ncbi:MAG TPA: helix-turn-helix domain-containing protein [Tepidisphaeraceae bacterium]|nr:helix-turn-helix domain-containing protein [Tepidisphaeraceae bacterium]
MATDYLTATELGERLKLSAATVRTLTKRGRIPCVRLSGKVIRFDPQAVADADAAQRRSHARDSAGGDPSNWVDLRS